MTLLRLVFAILLVALGSGRALATTWDEPWHREVVVKATSFGLYEVVKSGPGALTLQRIKHIAGDETGATIEVNGFYALRLTSRSADHGPEFSLPVGTRAYFHLQRSGGAWAVATPSAGYAPLRRDGKVAGTYRFSAHQALVDPALYEDTQRCIFMVLHGRKGCEASLAAFVGTELAKPAEGLGEDSTSAGREEFFRQHVALETAGLVHIPIPDATLERFLAKADTHVQLSAVRSLAGSPRSDRAERLMRFVEDDQARLPARMLAALLLQETGAHEMKQRLQDYAARASEEEAGLGMEIMDPRIGTRFPDNLREAVRLAAAQL